MKTAQSVEERWIKHIARDVAAGAEAEDEIARTVGIVRDKGDAGGLVGQLTNPIRDDAIRFKLMQQAVAKGVSADRADGGALHAEPSRLHREDEGRAAGVGSAEGTGPIERLVDAGPHDFDQRFTDGEDVEGHGAIANQRSGSLRIDMAGAVHFSLNAGANIPIVTETQEIIDSSAGILSRGANPLQRVDGHLIANGFFGDVLEVVRMNAGVGPVDMAGLVDDDSGRIVDTVPHR